MAWVNVPLSPALSCDDIPSYDEVLATACKNLEKNGEIDREALLPYPSILFGMETALLHFRARSLQFWHTPFSKGKEGIPHQRTHLDGKL